MAITKRGMHDEIMVNGPISIQDAARNLSGRNATVAELRQCLGIFAELDEEGLLDCHDRGKPGALVTWTVK